jgi:hypothetical protein
MHPVETYLNHLARIHSTGGAVAETSYYGALEGLLNEIGGKLKPKVRCVPQLKNTGAGSPDFGLYTANQFQRAKDEKPLPGVLPDRGVIEVKGWSDDSFVRAKSSQVSKYWQRYGLVLVTNYRDFVLVGRDEAGKPVRLETYRMAGSESAFLDMLAHPHKAAAEQGDRLVEFLRRVLFYKAPLTNPEDLAWFLASYAREARCRVEEAAGLPALDGLKKGLEEALGMKFEGEKGEHFFRATLVQTLFYGVFSSWVLWSRDHWGKPDARFEWHNAAWTLHVPMVKSLFDQIATPTRLKPLGVDEVLDWAGAALNRVDRRAFFEKFEEEHAVQYFYEPFLKAYDPELRKDLGVWYTPPEIVQYQVERVDRVLREELGLPDGLADDRVVVLDPCCGTGAYLVETLKRIHKTLEEKGASALTAQKLKKAAIERVFGFEILPAPFVVAHLQLGLMLRLLGAPLDHDSDQRAGVYLTNALTGWEPPAKPKDELPLFPELMEERDAANKVKSESPILVILGNPPYNAFAGTSPEEEGGLVEPYKEGLTTPVNKGGWGIKKFNLDDLYVRFFRIAERRIAKSGKGVVCFISNYSWTSEPSFVVMRKRLLESFDKFWIENLHGNRKITEYAPDGRTSETVFAISGTSPGIQQGVVVSLWVRRQDHKDTHEKHGKVLYRNDIDAAKADERRQQLLASLNLKNLDRKYETAKPGPTNRYSFRPAKVASHYLAWPLVTTFSALPPFNGPVERRGLSLISIGRDEVSHRMRQYFNPSVDNSAIANLHPSLMMTGNRIVGPTARKGILKRFKFDDSRIARYPFKPFDVRWCYLENLRPLFSEPSPQLLKQRFPGNAFFMTRDTADKTPEGPPFLFSSLVCDYDCISGHTRHFPVRIMNGERLGQKQRQTFFGILEETIPADESAANLSSEARVYLQALRLPDSDKDAETAGLIWIHALAIGYSPAYLDENADGIRQDWPRIPLPATKKALLASTELGRRVAALLDTERPVDGVTCGKIDPRLKSIAIVSNVGGGALDPARGHLDLTARWGRGGKDGVCMPGRGKTEVRRAKGEERNEVFGEKTLDVYLNDTAYWANVPEAVWGYHIGGYQVIKKWLSYREKGILGRGLKLEEAEYVTETARRIAALILLQPELDANYQAVKADTWPWPQP